MSGQVRSLQGNIARVSCDTCFMGHLGGRIRWWTLISISEPRSGQVHVKMVKFWNSKIYLQNIPILSSFVSGLQKCHLFWHTPNRNAKNCSSRKWCHHLYLVFGPLHSQTIKISVWNFVHWLLLYSSILSFWFFGYLQKFWFCRNLFWKNRNIDFGDKKKENPRQPFSRVFNLALWAFMPAFCSKTLHSRCHWSLAVLFFTENRVTWRHKTPFSKKKKSDGFC